MVDEELTADECPFWYAGIPFEFKVWKFGSAWGSVAYALGNKWPMQLKCAAMLSMLGFNLMMAGALANEFKLGREDALDSLHPSRD